MEAGKKLKLGAIMNKKAIKEEPTEKVETPQESHIEVSTQLWEATAPLSPNEISHAEKTNEVENEASWVQEIKSALPIDKKPSIGIHKDSQIEKEEDDENQNPVEKKEKEEKQKTLEKLKKVENIGIHTEETKKEEKKHTEKEEVFTSYQADLYKDQDEALQGSKAKKEPIKKEEVDENKKWSPLEQEWNKSEIEEKPTEIKKEWEKMEKDTKNDEKKEDKNALKQKEQNKEEGEKVKKPKKAMKFVLTSMITLASMAAIIWGVFFIDTGSDFIENYKTSILDMVNKNVSEEDQAPSENSEEEIEEPSNDTNSWITQNWDIETIVFWRTSEEVKVVDNNGIKEFEYNWEIYGSKETVYNVIRITTIKRVILDYFKILK